MIYKGADNKFLLELNIEQLITLEDILNYIGGDPKTTRRKYIEPIINELNEFICENFFDEKENSFTYPFIESNDIKCINNQTHLGLYFQENKNNV